jgi:F0F1-type ATP synthase assembly protein I
MQRRAVYVVVLLSWVAGLAFLAGAGWLLDRWVAPGALKTVLNALLVGLAITLFGVTPRAAFRAAQSAPPRGGPSGSGIES